MTALPMTTLYLTALLALATAPVQELVATAPDSAFATIRKRAIHRDVEYLAANALEGRCAGEAGIQRAAAFLSRRMEQLGLEAVGDDDTYYQEFEFLVRGAGSKKATARNVLGLLRGHGPLADEVIVVGAHYDHVGTTASADAGRMGSSSKGDTIWNGADDNASGTAVVMSVAEALAKAPERLPRSVLFILFDAEEQGLLGSLHYCKEPVIPLAQTVAMINLDMVGRNSDKPLGVLGTASLAASGWERLVHEARVLAPDLMLKTEGYGPPNSDHEPFVQQQIPSVHLFSGLHDDYHTPGDHTDKVDFERMVEVARFTAGLIQETARTPDPLEFQEPRFQTRPRRSLEINTDGALGREEMKALGFDGRHGGFRVTFVRGNSVASAAGLKEGDVILSVRGRQLGRDDPSASLRRLVAGSSKGKDHEILVWRDGAEVELTARWE